MKTQSGDTKQAYENIANSKKPRTGLTPSGMYSVVHCIQHTVGMHSTFAECVQDARGTNDHMLYAIETPTHRKRATTETLPHAPQ